MLNTTAREFRPHASTSNNAEDLQPNEVINKRQRAAPPPVLSASVKLPSKFNNARWKHSSRGRGRGRGGGFGQQGIGSSHSGWTQQVGRGNGPWRGTFSARPGRHGRGASSSPAWRHPLTPFRTESPQTSNAVAPAKPPILKQDQPDQTSISLPNSPLRFMPLVTTPPTTKPLAIKRDSRLLPPISSLPLTNCPSASHSTHHSIPNSHTYPHVYQESVQPSEPPELVPSLIRKRSASPPTKVVRGFTPPLKRRMLDQSHVPSTVVKVEDVEPVPSLDFHSHSPATPEIIKVEKRSSSPPPRRLVTESCSFFPLPEDCRKSSLQYRKNRQAFFTREYNVLKCLGLRRTKVIFRDDGMVIEWTSNIPVWSDTLRPEPSNLSSVIDEALQANSTSLPSKRNSLTPRRSSTHTVESHTIVAEDPCSSRQATWSAKPKSSPHSESKGLTSPIPLPRRRIFPQPQSPQVTASDELVRCGNYDHGMQPRLVQNNATIIHADNDHATASPTMATSGIKTTVAASNVGVWSAEELGGVEPMAVDYLQRYLRAFDTDRCALQNAYSADALFSYRMTLVSPMTSQSSSFISYRLPQVTSSLSTVLPLYKFCVRDGAGEVHYDVVSLDGRTGGGILLTVHGALGRPDVSAELSGSHEYDHLVAVDQSFVLHRNRLWDRNDDAWNGRGSQDTDGMDTLSPWPLVAVSHHMIVRDLDVRSGRIKYPLPITSSSEQFSWLA